MVVETLKNMNQTTANHASWVVRVLSPKVNSYEFKSRNEVAKATQFRCILVSQYPKQLMIGSVPFSFAAKDAASKAKDIFQDGLTFEIKNPQLDTKMKADFVS